MTPDVLNNRGWAYYLKGNYAQGLADANASLIIRPHDADTLDTRATVYQSLGDLNQAIADWEEAVGLMPDDAELREKLDKARAKKAAQDTGSTE
jgi:tetratricopeptide (TPR) repeat protein